MAPRCAARSPSRSAGVRDAATKRSTTCPVSRVGGSRIPSSSMVVASGGIEPGAVPPTSAWWARFATQPTSAPSRKTGATRVTSLRCVPPANGSFTITSSPGRGARSGENSASAACTDAGIDPRWTGMCSACTSRSPPAVNSAAEQSARSLMFGLEAARRSTAPISSATDARRDARIWSAAGSSSATGEHPCARRARRGRPPVGDPHRAIGLRHDGRARRRFDGRPLGGRGGRRSEGATRAPEAQRPRPRASRRAKPLRASWTSWKACHAGSGAAAGWCTTTSSWLCPS